MLSFFLGGSSSLVLGFLSQCRHDQALASVLWPEVFMTCDMHQDKSSSTK